MRLTTTRSYSGNASTMTGANTAYHPAAKLVPGARYVVRIVSTPSTNPITSEPLSPMKIFAGGKFHHRNPSSDPSNSASVAATNHWWIDSAVTRNAVVQTAATPAL